MTDVFEIKLAERVNAVSWQLNRVKPLTLFWLIIRFLFLNIKMRPKLYFFKMYINILFVQKFNNRKYINK